MDSKPGTEILVHIAAPSTAHDDARYRAQVAAILQFQSASRQQLIHTSLDLDSDPDQADPHPDHHAHPFSADALHPHHSLPTPQHEVPSPILREAPRPEGERLPSDPHTRSQTDPQLRGQIIEHRISSIPDSLESPISVIPDSQPEIGHELVRAASYRATLSPELQDDRRHKRRRTALSSPDRHDSIHRVTISDSSASVQPEAARTMNPVHGQEPTKPISIPSSNPELELEINNLPPPPPATTATPATTASPAPTAPTAPTSIPNLINLTTLPLQIHPPKPPISTSTFTTHITPTLAMLAERLKPARTYKPSHQSRTLDPLERGYWLVRFAIATPSHDFHDHDRVSAGATRPGSTDPTPNQPKAEEESHVWPAQLFGAFWSFLQDFVGKDGRAGWGVWCILEKEEVRETVTHLSLKVYAWGEIAMHMYLLLFLASERRIRGLGVQWRDASEEVVIQMP
ncbi:uncharacterized protein N7515_008788 [Penicillium bovifimosum]|uniref:Uncharacterized protein n=1 Tax=Penicillium bovifimosum TaxID=126998 RepID=A0A9W9GNY1_9EURO|nr:uncharacterized protein N7515_008788 [Penicillium bovifimosum]KAJ5124963.1 hypothetical protein N7515_008788 [Penicillium bovifimosum]